MTTRERPAVGDHGAQQQMRGDRSDAASVARPALIELMESEAFRINDDLRAALVRLEDAWEQFVELIAEAHSKRVWIALGHESWQAYVHELVGSAVRLPPVLRRRMVGQFAGAGLSSRAIAAALGVNQSTVARDLARDADASPDAPHAPVTGLDGKQYPRREVPAIEKTGKGGPRDAITTLDEATHALGHVAEILMDTGRLAQKDRLPILEFVRRSRAALDFIESSQQGDAAPRTTWGVRDD